MSYVFIFLIALFKDFSLLLGISNMSCSLDENVTDAICGNNGDDGVVSTRDSNIGPAAKSMRILARVGDTVTKWLLSDYGGSSWFI